MQQILYITQCGGVLSPQLQAYLQHTPEENIIFCDAIKDIPKPHKDVEFKSFGEIRPDFALVIEQYFTQFVKENPYPLIFLFKGNRIPLMARYIPKI